MVANKRFSFTTELTTELLYFLKEYKTEKEFTNVDFNSDKARQYEHLRKQMASKHDGLFGPVELTTYEDDPEDEAERTIRENIIKKEKLEIHKGYQRIQERIKKLRQQFSEVVSKGRSSGSPKIILSNYDLLMSIYGGCAATEPLAYGIATSEDLSNSPRDHSLQDSDEDADNVAYELPKCDTSATPNVTETETDVTDIDASETDTIDIRKRKAVCPTLIDNKRKHMEKSLSAAQRDKLLMTEYKNDIQNRKDLLDVIREGNTAFQNSADKISEAMINMSNAFATIANCFAASQQPNHTQYATFPSQPQRSPAYRRMPPETSKSPPIENNMRSLSSIQSRP